MNAQTLPARLVAIVIMALLLATPAFAAEGAKPFVGYWALTLPGGTAGWLGVSEDKGQLSASLLWNVGSVDPVKHAEVQGDTLVLTRGEGKKAETITAKVDGDTLTCTLARPQAASASFTGKRIPPLPPKPDLSKVKFGEPITLFDGTDLIGWSLTDPNNSVSCWSVRNGLLTNDLSSDLANSGKPPANLRTEREFEDFNLTLEVNVSKEGNSGIYLRGIYEVQVYDSHGKKPDSHNMGAIYSRITPTESAERPAGEWQKFDITLVDRHVTVVLNGKRIIDNQPLIGCTGGALWSDQMRPGPIYFQGDHTSVQYRNIVLKPVVK